MNDKKEWVIGRLNKQTSAWMAEQWKRQTGRLTDGRVNNVKKSHWEKKIDKQMDGQRDKQLKRSTDEYIKVNERQMRSQE